MNEPSVVRLQAVGGEGGNHVGRGGRGAGEGRVCVCVGWVGGGGLILPPYGHDVLYQQREAEPYDKNPQTYFPDGPTAGA